MGAARGASSLRVAEGVRGGVATLKSHLVGPQPVLEFDEELWIEGHAAVRRDVDARHPAPNAVGVELRVPRGVERVREIDASAVATDLDHLRPAIQRALAGLRVRRPPDDATD